MLLACVAFLAPAGEARAEFDFTPPQTLVKGHVGNTREAVDPQGRVTVVWEVAAAGPAGPTDPVRLIYARQVDADGTPGPIHKLDEFPRYSPNCPCPHVAVDPAGRATIVWQAYDGKFRIRATQIDAAGNVGPIHTLSPAGYNGWNQEVAVDPQGRATIVWTLGSSVDNVETVRFGVDGEPEEVRVLAEDDSGARPPALAVDSEGKATIAWSSVEGMRTVQIDAAGVPGPIRPISPTSKLDGAVDVVVDGLGRATISWWRGGGAYEAKSVRLDAEGVPGAVQDLSPPGQDTLDPHLAVDPQGRVTAAWQAFDSRIYTVQLDEEGAPETVYPLSEAGRRAGEPQVAVGPDGRAMVVWSHPSDVYAPEEGCLEEAEFEAAADVVKIAFLGPEGAPEQVKNVSPFGEQSLASQIALDAQGRPTVLWESYDGTYYCEIRTRRIQISRGFTPPVDPPPVDPPPVDPPPVDPPPVDPPPPPPAPGPKGSGLLRLSGGGTAKDGRLRLLVRCAGGAGACAGNLRLEAPVASIPRRLKESLGSPPWLRSRVTVARGDFQLAPGARRTLVLTLTGYGKRLASKGSGQSLRLVGRGSGVRGSVVWVRLRSHVT